MPLLPPHHLDAVVAIGAGTKQNRSWIGTGFFYGKPVKGTENQEDTKYHIFLVTNRHVVQGLQKACMRLNSKADNTFKEYDLGLKARNGKPVWVGHPDESVDIVAIWINAGFLDRDRRSYSFFSEDKTTVTASQLKESSISEGDGVFLLGYPMGLVGEHHHVICRSGSLARVRDVKNGEGKTMLLDGLVFPGNSGGPVITRPTAYSVGDTEAFNKAHLLGIVTSYVSYQDIAISQQTQKPRVIFEENSGLSVAHPAELIIETVNAAHKRMKSRIQRNARKVKANES